jgi:predicted DNA-binding transcriptional regulator AlpA
MSTAHSLDQIKAELAELRQLITEQTDTILTVEDVRELTGLSKSAIYQKTCSRDGNPPELPTSSAGKRLYFKRPEIVEWMTGHRVTDRVETMLRYASTDRIRSLLQSRAVLWAMIASRFIMFMTEMITCISSMPEPCSHRRFDSHALTEAQVLAP